MRAVIVKVHGTEKPPGCDADGMIGVLEARAGRPVEIRVERGNMSHVMRLSFAEATELHDDLESARGGS